MRSEKILEHF